MRLFIGVRQSHKYTSDQGSQRQGKSGENKIKFRSGKIQKGVKKSWTNQGKIRKCQNK